MQKFDYNVVEQKIGYCFKNKQILKQAFIHSSYANEHKAESNERLEFLGDSVLSLIVTDHIYNHYTNNEGDLSKIRASLVSEKSLSFIFEQLGLCEYIIRGVGIEKSKPTIAMMADAFEALVASIYIDGGLLEARNFVLNKLETALKDIKQSGVPDSKKSMLQEKFKNEKIVYQTKAVGEGQEKIYHSKVLVNGVVLGVGAAQKKRDAEEKAAFEAIKQIKKV